MAFCRLKITSQKLPARASIPLRIGRVFRTLTKIQALGINHFGEHTSLPRIAPKAPRTTLPAFPRREIDRPKRPKTDAESKQLERQWLDIAFDTQRSR